MGKEWQGMDPFPALGRGRWRNGGEEETGRARTVEKDKGKQALWNRIVEEIVLQEHQGMDSEKESWGQDSETV